MTLDTRLNAVRALESRISLIKSYLWALFRQGEQACDNAPVALSHSTLRGINSLISHLSLLAPQDTAGFTTETIAQSNDVALVSILGELSQSVKGMREVGKKSAAVQSSRQNANARKGMSRGLGSGRQKTAYNEEFFRGL